MRASEWLLLRITILGTRTKLFRRWRTCRNSGTSELAEKADVGLNTIWRLEHGVMGAQPRTIRKLARALGVEPEELVKTGGGNA